MAGVTRVGCDARLEVLQKMTAIREPGETVFVDHAPQALLPMAQAGDFAQGCAAESPPVPGCSGEAHLEHAFPAEGESEDVRVGGAEGGNHRLGQGPPHDLSAGGRPAKECIRGGIVGGYDGAKAIGDEPAVAARFRVATQRGFDAPCAGGRGEQNGGETRRDSRSGHRPQRTRGDPPRADRRCREGRRGEAREKRDTPERGMRRDHQKCRSETNPEEPLCVGVGNGGTRGQPQCGHHPKTRRAEDAYPLLGGQGARHESIPGARSSRRALSAGRSGETSAGSRG